MKRVAAVVHRTPVHGLRIVVMGLGVAAALATLSGCATDSYGGPINGDQALSSEERRLQAVETKLADLSRRLNSTDSNRDQRIVEDLGSLRGSVEQMRYDFEQGQRRSSEREAAMETRIRALEGVAAAAQAAFPGAAPGFPVDGNSQGPVGGGAGQAPPASAAADEEAAYLRSFDLLKAGKYDDAIRGFKGMLEQYPQGNYSDNGWYWTAESYYIKKDYPNALASYRALLERFASSPKVPDSLLKTGIILQDQKKTAQARSAYDRVIKEFPNSSAAVQARTRLGQIR